MDMNIEVEEKDDQICVCVKIPRYDSRVKRKTIVNTGNVRAELINKGIELGPAVKEAYLHNLNGVTEGMWVFQKKIVDKVVEPVILKEEKPVRPKPKRPRRTRSSTKKVSIED
jgi:hypothetical protein